MKKTGELIKAARESKGLSIHEISLNLKINSKVLKAIEEGDMKNLPAKTFLRGFVKSYAQYLKMDTGTVLSTFTEEMGSTKPEIKIEAPAEMGAPPETSAPVVEKPVLVREDSKKNEPTPQPKKKQAEEPKPRIIAEGPRKIGPIVYSVAAALLVLLIIGVKQIVGKYQKETVVETPTVTQTIQPEQPIAVVTSTTVPLVTTSTTLAVEVETKNINPKPTVPVSADNMGEIVVQAKKDVSLSLKTAQGEKQNIDMKANDVHTFRTSVGLEILVNNASAVDVYVNGKSAGKASDSDKPVKLVY